MTTNKTATKKRTPTFGEIWNCLSRVNVNKHLEKKGDYDYLPWAIAWAIVMEHYPETTFQNQLNDNGYPCFYDPQGFGMVRVTVTVCGHSHTEDYMITNYSNRVIQDPDPNQVNNCLKRALVKCLAYFGLGSYLYNQLDMLEDDSADEVPIAIADEVPIAIDKQQAPILLTKLQQKAIEKYIETRDNGQKLLDKYLDRFKIDNLSELSKYDANRCLEKIEEKRGNHAN